MKTKCKFYRPVIFVIVFVTFNNLFLFAQNKFSLTLYGGIIEYDGKNDSATLLNPAKLDSISADSIVNIQAIIPKGYKFGQWLVLNSLDTSKIDTTENKLLNNADSSKTYFIMPKKNIAIEAVLKPFLDTLTVINGIGSGVYSAGDTVYIKAVSPPDLQFEKWDAFSFYKFFGDSMDISTYFIMPSSNAIIEALFGCGCGAQIALNVINGTGSGAYDTSSVVDIAAYPPDSAGHAQCYVFNGWTAIPQSDTIYIKNLKDTNTVVTLPNISGSSILILATYIPLKHKLTIIRGIVVYNATADSMYFFGDTLYIQANAPPPDSVFAGWSGDTLTIAYPYSNLTTIVMPCQNITLKAIFGCGSGDNINQLSANKISIYPNPAKDKITIENLDKNYSNTIEIFDISGQVVMLKTIQKDNSVDVSNLASGLYIVKVSNSSGALVSKLIKE